MFSKISVFSALLAVVLSVPAQEPVEIVAQNSDISPDGTFKWAYEAADGTKVEQSGVPKTVADSTAEVVQGSIVYSDPEGGKHELTYTADEGGYHPQGADIPVAPAVPAHILKALEWIAAHPQPVVESN